MGWLEYIDVSLPDEADGEQPVCWLSWCMCRRHLIRPCTLFCPLLCVYRGNILRLIGSTNVITFSRFTKFLARNNVFCLTFVWFLPVSLCFSRQFSSHPFPSIPASCRWVIVGIRGLPKDGKRTNQSSSSYSRYVTPSGIIRLLRFVHPLNASGPIYFKVLGNRTDRKFRQPSIVAYIDNQWVAYITVEKSYQGWF